MADHSQRVSTPEAKAEAFDHTYRVMIDHLDSLVEDLCLARGDSFPVPGVIFDLYEALLFPQLRYEDVKLRLAGTPNLLFRSHPIYRES